MTELTLGFRERLLGRSLRQYDPDERVWYCTECLDNLPADRLGQSEHRCPPAPAYANRPEPEPAAVAVVEHRTWTTDGPTELAPDGSGVARYGRMASAYCSCGRWSHRDPSRSVVRLAARYHREHPDGAR